MSEQELRDQELREAALLALSALDWEGGNSEVRRRLAAALGLPDDYRWVSYGILADEDAE